MSCSLLGGQMCVAHLGKVSESVEQPDEMVALSQASFVFALCLPYKWLLK